MFKKAIFTPPHSHPTTRRQPSHFADGQSSPPAPLSSPPHSVSSLHLSPHILMASPILRSARIMRDVLRTLTLPPVSPVSSPSSSTLRPSRTRSASLLSNSSPMSNLVSCLRVSDHVLPARLFVETVSADGLLAFRALLRQRQTPQPSPTLTSVGGDTLLLVRARVAYKQLSRLAQGLRPPRRRAGSFLSRMNASAGMALAAALAAERRPPVVPPNLLRMLASTSGPQRFGVGLFPPLLRSLLATALFLVGIALGIFTLVQYPTILPWLFSAFGVCFATRPDLASFFIWVKQSAPLVAARKTLLVDKLRATIAPYVMGFGSQPVLTDYGVFSVVTLMDSADYVYVYAGAMSRWCLLGWYNANDDYNFDRIRALR